MAMSLAPLAITEIIWQIRLLRHARKHFLVIGPWDHAGTRTPTDEVAGVKFGPGAVIDLNDLHRQWYDWTMKSGPRPEFLKNQVAYYLLAAGNSGANGEWKYADNFETLVANPKIFYLDSKNGDANGVFRSGSLIEKQPSEGLDTFIYDPLDTTRGERVDGIDPKEKTAGIDQTYPLSIAKDGLVYHTEALPNETSFIGCPAVTLWVSIDTPDVDLSAHLYEIQPDGTSIVLWSDTRRLRYRDSLREAKLVKPGEISTLRLQSRIIRCSPLNEREPPSPGRVLPKFDSVPKELLFWRRSR